MPRHVRSPESEFADLADRSTERFAREFIPMLTAVAEEDGRKREKARERVAKVIGETMAMSDLLGRRRAILEFKSLSGTFAASPLVPTVTFPEAISDIAKREPMLAANAQEVAELYRTRHAFALARSAETELTKAVQSFVLRALKEGKPEPRAAQIVRGMGDWTRSYAGVVYRTNLNTAYTAGRMEQAREPEIRTALPAFQRFSVTDSAVRRGRKEDGGENHLAANGLIADTRDTVWARCSPPSGYNCRCTLRLMSAGELKRKGLLNGTTVQRYEPPGFGAFRPHPNFGQGRPDAAIYG